MVNGERCSKPRFGAPSPRTGVKPFFMEGDNVGQLLANKPLLLPFSSKPANFCPYYPDFLPFSPYFGCSRGEIWDYSLIPKRCSKPRFGAPSPRTAFKPFFMEGDNVGQLLANKPLLLPFSSKPANFCPYYPDFLPFSPYFGCSRGEIWDYSLIPKRCSKPRFGAPSPRTAFKPFFIVR